MNKQPVFRRTLIAAATALALLGASGMARAVDELEGQNNSLGAAQKLTIGSDGSVTVNGVVGVMTPGTYVLDVDFYSFEGKAGDVVTFDIDDGTGGLRKVDTVIYLFGPGIPIPKPSDDAEQPDEGSITFDGNWTPDSYLTFWEGLPQTGTYTIAVTAYNVAMDADGSYSAPMGLGEEDNGDYKLIISGVTPPAATPDPDPVPVPEPTAETIKIDVRSSAHALHHGKHKDQITIALLASPTFNPVTDVDVSSLTFGLNGDEHSLRKCDQHKEDHAGKKGSERRRHLVCHFSADASGLDVGNNLGVLKGQKTNGTPFQASGFLKVGKPKRGQRHARSGR